jgi:nucleoside-diphosphate-sugar epimerase
MSRVNVFSLPIVLRVLADAVMSVVALTGAMIVTLFLGMSVRPGLERVPEFFQAWLVHAPMITVVSLVVYAAWGFYGRVRFLPVRMKTVEMLGAVTLAFSSFGLIQAMLQVTPALEPSTLVLAWSFAALLVLLSRYWSMTWRGFAVAEAGLLRTARAEEQRPRVLVIGGAGYIGSALLPHLFEAGYRVRVLDLLLFGEEPIKQYLDHPDLELVRADFRQVDTVVASMKDVDAVVHLGGLVGDPACSLDEALTTEVNLEFTRVIAEVAKGSGVKRFLFASSCSVYGASDEMLDETSRLNPVSLYARSKIASENVLFDMASPTFVPTMMRFGTIYGLSGRPRFDLVVNLLSAKAVTDGKITVFGGDQWRPFVHVEDAARAMLLALNAPVSVVRNEIFNVGSDAQNATLADIGRAIQAQVPGSEVIDSGLDGDRRNYRVDFTKIRDQLGFTANWTLERGIRQVIDAVASGAVADFTDPRYSNVRFLKEGTSPRFARVRTNWAQQRIGGDMTRSAKSQADARIPSDVDSVPGREGEIRVATQQSTLLRR